MIRSTANILVGIPTNFRHTPFIFVLFQSNLRIESKDTLNQLQLLVEIKIVLVKDFRIQTKIFFGTSD